MSCNCSIESTDCVKITPSEICLEFVHDTDASFEFILLDGRGEPVDITSDSVRLTVRDKKQGTQKLTKVNASGSHSDPTNGKTVFAFTPGDITDTLTDDPTQWVYEVRRIESGGDEAVHIEGDFLVHLDVGKGS